MNVLKDLLDEYRVTRDFQKEVREGYRVEIEEHLKNVFDTNCNFRYGGSLAKSTANINSCDIDLLTYLDNDTSMSLQEIYDTTYNSLRNDYVCEKKNSAITIHGKLGETWEYNVDVVPGKFSSNDTSSDVYLWQNNSRSRLKTNPEKQIKKVKESTSKDVIRIIKLYRQFNNFKFKSFFLEIFAVDLIEPDYAEGDSLHDKMVKFCSRYADIGVSKIYDPANSNNDIMKIHTEAQFCIIRNKIKLLYDVLMTDNEETIKNCILGKSFDIDDAYKKNAINNSIMRTPSSNSLIVNSISIQGYVIKETKQESFHDYTVLKKGIDIKFIANVPISMNISNVRWIIANSGYDAKKNNCLRGDEIESSNDIINLGNSKRFGKNEVTAYYGNHFVQAVLTTKSGFQFYSNVLKVKIR